tara:strand:+ start:181 stop:525 length:345 start_codon:yes stop_codon:yes gene_type:complete
MAAAAAEVAPHIGGFVKGEIARGKRDAKIISKALIRPKMQGALDNVLKGAGLSGGFGKWLRWGDSGGRWGRGQGVPIHFPAGFGDTGARFLQPATRRIIGQPQVQSPNHAYFLS